MDKLMKQIMSSIPSDNQQEIDILNVRFSDIETQIEEIKKLKNKNSFDSNDLNKEISKVKQDFESKMFEIRRRIEAVEENNKRLLTAPESTKPILQTSASFRKSIESNGSNKNSKNNECINEVNSEENNEELQAEATIESNNSQLNNISPTSKKLKSTDIEGRIKQLEKMFSSFK